MAQAKGASISLVHDTLLDLANKDQQGFVSDAEFNNFAQIAQLNVYNRLFDELKDAKRLSRAGFNPMRDKSRIKRIEEDLAYFSKKPIELCYDEEKIERILISTLSSPTEDFPVALVSDSIHVFPTSINKVELRYYKLPQGRTSDAGARTPTQPTYVATGAPVDFELPEHYTADLIYEIAKMVGINLRDADVVRYANGEVVSNRQAETF